MPLDRAGEFQPMLFARYQRSERALVLALAETSRPASCPTRGTSGDRREPAGHSAAQALSACYLGESDRPARRG